MPLLDTGLTVVLLTHSLRHVCPVADRKSSCIQKGLHFIENLSVALFNLSVCFMDVFRSISMCINKSIKIGKHCRVGTLQFVINMKRLNLSRELYFNFGENTGQQLSNSSLGMNGLNP